MKKMYLSLIILTSIFLVSCGIKNEENSDAGLEKNNTEETVETSSEPNAFEAIDAIGDIDVDKGLFNVEITVPKELAGENTQEELDAIKDEKGYKSVTKNSEGSVTYVMNKKQHQELMDATKEGIEEGINEIINSEDYPNIADIKYNNDYTKFSIMTKSEDLSLLDGLIAYVLSTYGEMYNVYNGTPVDNIKFEWINANTGEVFDTSNSKDSENE